MAAGPIATQARWSINSASQGNIRLKRLKDYKISDEASAEAVTAVGEDVPVGFRFKPGAKTLTFTVYAEQGPGEVNWQALRDTREIHSYTKELVSGLRVQYPECIVSKVEPSGDDEGTHMFDVEVIALREKQL